MTGRRGGGGREEENPKQAYSCQCGEPDAGLDLTNWYEHLSGNQGADSQATEPPKCPWTSLLSTNRTQLYNYSVPKPWRLPVATGIRVKL